MISAPTIAALEERGLEYVLGARAHRQPGAHRGACGSEAVYALVHPTRHGQRAAPDRDAVITALKPDHGPSQEMLLPLPTLMIRWPSDVRKASQGPSM